MTVRRFGKALFFALPLLVACGGSKRDLLKTQAASDFDCQAITVTAMPGYAYYEKASGCGKEIAYLYDFSAGKWVSALERASFEMSCDRKQLKATQLDSATVGIEGCEKKSVYKIVPGAGWVLDSASSGSKSEK